LKFLLIPSLSITGSTLKLNRRDWPLVHWLRLSALLSKEFHCDTLVHVAVVDQFREFPNITISRSLDELVSCIKLYDTVVSTDSGPLHIADHLKKTVFGLFGATNPLNFSGPCTTVIRKKRHCSPCHDGREFILDCAINSCMHTLTADYVYNKILEELENVIR
jgi:ADP-heptose:LPS heptosyltransferase